MVGPREWRAVRVPNRPPWGPPQVPIFHSRAPTHVIAVLVAATHQPAPSGTGIGRVRVDSRLRGNDVWGDGGNPELVSCTLAM